MPNPPQQATDLIEAFNAWASNDLDVTPAAVTHCSRKSLPENHGDAMRLIHDVHKSFFDRAAGPNFENLDFTTPVRKVTDFDPTDDMYPAASDTPAGAKAQTTAKTDFQARPIEVIQVSGTDAAHDLNIALQIALDPQASLIFSFITALSD